MPTYTYLCFTKRASHTFEVEQRIADAPLTKCLVCGREGVKRQIPRGTSFVLRGRGWARDGYR